MLITCHNFYQNASNLIRKRYKTLIKKQSGAALVETALVLPLFLWLLFATIETGLIVVIKVNLQSLVITGSRFGSLHAADGSNTIAAITNVMQKNASSLLNFQRINISIRSYPNFAAVSGSKPNALNQVKDGAIGAGGVGAVARYHLSYSYKPFTPLFAQIFGAQLNITATAFVKNY